MTDKFESLKSAAEQRVKAEEAVISGWIAKYRWVLYLACGAAGFILAKIFQTACHCH